MKSFRFLATLLLCIGSIVARAQTIVVQGFVSETIGTMSVPLPGQTVIVQVGPGFTTTSFTDSTGFYSVVVALPVFSPNQLIQVSTLCPTGGPLVQTVPLNPAVTTYQVDLACGAGGGGSITMVSVSGVLQWPTGPAPAGQVVQFFVGTSTSPVGVALTASGGFFADTLNIPFGTSPSVNLRASASCGNGTMVQDTMSVSSSVPSAFFQLSCVSSPTNQITVQGTVLGSSGAPVVSSLVRISFANSGTVTTFTDSVGYYSATLNVPVFLPSNAITVMASCSSPTGPGSTVTGTANYSVGTTNYTVNLACGSVSRVLIVSGSLVNAFGQGLPGQSVQLFLNQYSTLTRAVTTDANGQFADTITVGPGAGFVYARGACGANTSWASDTVSYFSGSFNVALQLQCATPAGQHRVVGRITGYQSSGPIWQDTLSLVVIRIVPPGQGQVAGWTTIDTVYLVDSSGSAFFQLTLPTGNYSLLARLISGLASQYAPTYYGDTTTWTAADSFQLPGNAASLFVINLRSNTSGGGTGTIGGGVAGNLPRLSGPLSGIQVQLLNANGTVPLSFRRSTTTGSTGSFQFSGLPWGSYLLRCEHPGMHSVTVPVTLSAQNPSHQSTTFSAGTTGFMVTSSVRNLLGGPRSTLKPNPVRAGQSLHWLIEEEEGGVLPGGENPVVTWEITDLQGKIHGQGSAHEVPETPNSSGLGGTLSLEGIDPGIYLLRVQRPSGSALQGRFLILP